MERLEVCLLARRFLDILMPLEHGGRINVLLSPDNVNIHGGGVVLRREVAAPWVKPRAYDGYSAPELYDGEELPATPVYYVGAVMYHMLQGAPPLAAPQRKPDAPLMMGAGPAEAVVDKATALKPEERYKNLPDMAAALDDAIRALGGDPDEQPEQENAPGDAQPAKAELREPEKATIGPPPELAPEENPAGETAGGGEAAAGESAGSAAGQNLGENPVKKNLI